MMPPLATKTMEKQIQQRSLKQNSTKSIQPKKSKQYNESFTTSGSQVKIRELA